MMGSMGSFTDNYIRCLLGVSFIAVAIMLVRKLAGSKMSRRFVYGMWLAVPVFMCVSPFVRLPLPESVTGAMSAVGAQMEYIWSDETEESTENTNVQETVSAMEIADVSAHTEQSETGTSETNGTQIAATGLSRQGSLDVHKVSGTTILGVLYWSIVALLAAVVLLVNIRFVVHCRKHREYQCQSAGKLAVYRLQGIFTPFLMGRCIYVPKGMEDEEFRYAVLHEEGHFKHGDALWVIVRYLILILYFYNPIIWMAFRYSGYDCELACDEEVLQSIQAKEKKAYGGCLLNTIEKRMGFANGVLLSTNMKSNKSLLKERIENIANEDKKSGLVMLVAASLVVGVTGVSLTEETTVAAEEQIVLQETMTSGTEEATFDGEDVSDIVKHGDDVQVCLEIWSRPVEETEETYLIEENGRELELTVDKTRPEFVGKAVGDTVLLVEEFHGTEYKYFYTILGINAEAGMSYQLPKDWNYELETTQEGSIQNNLEDWHGYRMFYVNADASSTLPPQGENGYSPTNLTVPASFCTWAEGAEGDGIGEFVEIRELYMGPGKDVLTFQQICIENGYAETPKKWQENNRVKSLKMYYGDVYMGTIALQDTINPQYIDLTPLQLMVQNGREARFRFEIAEVYEGTKYDDTCITTIAIDFGGNEEAFVWEE
ncbi:MAG: hypothetical protein IJF07_09830 [Lachnospiraceae bacterium]|nr:hypothetical protein [Lachnospiraceae bacterium]